VLAGLGSYLSIFYCLLHSSIYRCEAVPAAGQNLVYRSSRTDRQTSVDRQNPIEYDSKVPPLIIDRSTFYCLAGIYRSLPFSCGASCKACSAAAQNCCSMLVHAPLSIGLTMSRKTEVSRGRFCQMDSIRLGFARMTAARCCLLP